MTDLEIARKLQQIKSRAEHRGLEFGMTFKEVKRLMKLKTCFYSGIVFRVDGSYMRTLDRIDTARGYVDGNVVVCTEAINTLKGNLTHKEFLKILKAVVKLTSKPDPKTPNLSKRANSQGPTTSHTICCKVS